MNAKKTILILGGGFAGLAAANACSKTARRDIAVTLIDRSDKNIFAPLLPDIISARVNPADLCYDLLRHCSRRGVEFINDSVEDIDPADRSVHCASGKSFSADAIIIAAGCVTNFFGDSQLAEKSVGLKSIKDAQQIARIADGQIAGENSGKFAIAGGGYTGLEIAAHLVRLLRRKGGLSYEQIGERKLISVLEKHDKPLRNIPEKLREKLLKYLDRYGIRILSDSTATSVSDDGDITLSSGSTLENTKLFWAAGVRPATLVDSLQPDSHTPQRLAVDDHLQLSSYDRIFAAGDIAAAHRPGDTAPLRMGVQFSLAGGKLAGQNAVATLTGKKLASFDPLDPGYLMPLVTGAAVGEIMGLKVWGPLPLKMHYLLCAMRSWSMTNRINVARKTLI